MEEKKYTKKELKIFMKNALDGLVHTLRQKSYRILNDEPFKEEND